MTSFESPAHGRIYAAAVLGMAYRALGVNVPQADIRRSIEASDGAAGRHARMNFLVRDAEARGLAAVALRMKDAKTSLQHLQALDAVTILNHRRTQSSELGHLSVLQGLSRERIFRHDPALGARHSQELEEFLRLWRPEHAGNEVTGNVALVLARAPDHSRHCGVCDEPLSEYIRCGVCARAVYLQPSAALACTSHACSARAWAAVICPGCGAEIESLH